ncbi:replication-associated recombination protein A [Collinsella provencensis]|uniref:replication-associated recombination protein A n=1 Tax=Collinsella provencensis TaxID=1937461 RepID=UPI000C8587C4|nr:replication-associated recombination protein A [Collinsella provencensis]
MDTLFSNNERVRQLKNAPLAVRMRPSSLEDYVGQEKAVGPGSWLRNAIEHDVLSSVILYGPAGTGKTTLAHIIASSTKSEFVEVSAITGTVKDLRREIEEAKHRLMMFDRRTILFIDEIHRFSRSQQDALLHAVENRTVVMIGATTENPYFEVNSALLSRSRVVELTHLSDSDVEKLVRRALSAPEGLANKYEASDEVIAAICTLAAGDARAALTTLELASEIALTRPVDSTGEAPDENTEPRGEEVPLAITLEDVRQANPRRGLSYDKSGDMHYDVISAFIKSMRGSDPDAAVYWLARMIDAGEDPKFIARRIMIQASEDIGNADPMAFLIAEAAFKSAEVIGYPECRINLAQAAIYNALAPKSNAAEAAVDAAMEDIHTSGQREVPSYLRDRHRPGSDEYGEYKYPHDYPEGWVEQRYLPEGLERGAFWKPSGRGWEQWRAENKPR